MQSFYNAFCLAGLNAAVHFELCTLYKQTMCTRLPCSLLTQEPGIKANIYSVIYIIVHAGCGDPNVFNQTPLIYMPLQYSTFVNNNYHTAKTDVLFKQSIRLLQLCVYAIL